MLSPALILQQKAARASGLRVARTRPKGLLLPLDHPLTYDPPMGKQIDRQQLILKRLHEKRWMTAQQVKDALEEAGQVVTVRTLLRDLTDLIVHGWVEKNDLGKPHGFRRSARAPELDIQVMTRTAAVMVKLAEAELAQLMPPSSRGEVEALCERADATLKLHGGEEFLKRLRALPGPLNRARIGARPGILEALVGALHDRKRIEVMYRKRRELAPTRYVLDPLGLVRVGAQVRLVAHKVNSDIVQQHFVLERFDSVGQTTVDAVDPPGWDLDEHIASGAFAFRNSDQIFDVCMELDGFYLMEVTEQPLSETQTFEQRPDGWWRLRAQLPDTHALRQLILGMGKHVRVTEPPALVEVIAEHVEAMAVAYGVLGGGEERRDVIRGRLVLAAGRSRAAAGVLARLIAGLVSAAPELEVVGPGLKVPGRTGGPDVAVFEAGAEVPSLVVDLVEGSRAREVGRKGDWYAAWGVRERWIVDAEGGVEVFVYEDGWRLAACDEGRATSVALPGLEVVFEAGV